MPATVRAHQHSGPDRHRSPAVVGAPGEPDIPLWTPVSPPAGSKEKGKSRGESAEGDRIRPVSGDASVRGLRARCSATRRFELLRDPVNVDSRGEAGLDDEGAPAWQRFEHRSSPRALTGGAACHRSAGAPCQPRAPRPCAARPPLQAAPRRAFRPVVSRAPGSAQEPGPVSRASVGDESGAAILNGMMDHRVTAGRG